MGWLDEFKFDPLPLLQTTTNPSIQYFLLRDLLDKPVSGPNILWEDPRVLKILKKQLPDGSFPDKSAKKHINSPTNYHLLESYRNLGVLVEMYGMNRSHPSIEKVCEYIFSTQTGEGDFRGIYGTQYSPNYSGGILELLIKAGYVEDPRIEKAFQWFLSHQQTEGGWSLPTQSHGFKTADWEEITRSPIPLPIQPERPFAHMVTGIVIRAFGAHPKYRHHPDGQKAGILLISRFFKNDKYSSRRHADYWTKYSFPYWWHDLISVLEALAHMDFSPQEPGIRRALDYFRRGQQETGEWNFSLLKNKSQPNLGEWLTLALCRVFKRFYGV